MTKFLLVLLLAFAHLSHAGIILTPVNFQTDPVIQPENTGNLNGQTSTNIGTGTISEGIAGNNEGTVLVDSEGTDSTTGDGPTMTTQVEPEVIIIPDPLFTTQVEPGIIIHDDSPILITPETPDYQTGAIPEEDSSDDSSQDSSRKCKHCGKSRKPNNRERNYPNIGSVRYLTPTDLIVLGGNKDQQRVVFLQKEGSVQLSFAIYTSVHSNQRRNQPLVGMSQGLKLQVEINGEVKMVQVQEGVDLVSFTFNALKGSNQLKFTLKSSANTTCHSSLTFFVIRPQH